jgi:hypothetical protein
MAGQTIQGQAPKQPLHPHCRCVLVPVIIGMESDYQGAPNYTEWLARQSKKTQIDILGPSKYKIYAGGGKLSGFNKDNKVATLKDLGASRVTRKELEAEAVEKIDWENITSSSELKEKIGEVLDKYGITYDLDGGPASIASLQQVGVTVDRLLTTHPEIALAFKTLNINNFGKNSKNIFAHAYSFNGIVELNSEFYSSWSYLQEEYTKTLNPNYPVYGYEVPGKPVLLGKASWHPPGTTPQTIIYHEVIHTLDGEMTMRKNGGSVPLNKNGRVKESARYSKEVQRKAFKELGLKLTEANIALQVSQYGAKNSAEFLAEAYSEYLDSPNPRPMAMAVGRIVDADLKNLK